MEVLKLKTTHQYSDSSEKKEMVGWMSWLLLIAIIAMLGIVAYSLQFDPKTAISVASVGLLLAAASGLAGGFLGFLFGIPRTLQNQEGPKADGTTSPPAHVQIFEKARLIRRNGLQAHDSKAMERTIPIFRALIATDTENKFHRNYGQLGYVLKDKTPPEWGEAERCFSTAISIRGEVRTNGFPFYELNEAICLIMSDPMFKKEAPSRPTLRKKVVNDLRVAVQLSRARIDEPRQIAERTLLNRVGEIELTALHKEAGAGHQGHDMVAR